MFVAGYLFKSTARHLAPQCLGPGGRQDLGQSTLPLPVRIKSVGWLGKLLGETPAYGLIFQSVAQIMTKMGTANRRE